ncbi:hypothetical protein BCR39DRAFT_559834 [Naematelia encephala]|uniref:Uncharacterized protein n=1 Tax=Naematelia encephala TaxID=71784 RepID=A0A1Y2AYU0_9TREE|nr:hypothetical protein BCR39DRAFT_559834 [Naematelia encephala]
MASDRSTPTSATMRPTNYKPKGDQTSLRTDTSMALASDSSRRDTAEEAAIRQKLTDMCRDRFGSCLKAFGKQRTDDAVTGLDSLETRFYTLWEPLETRIRRADPEDVKWCSTVVTDEEEFARRACMGEETAPSTTWNLTLSVNLDKTALTVTGSFARTEYPPEEDRRHSCLRFQYDVSIASLQQNTGASSTPHATSSSTTVMSPRGATSAGSAEPPNLMRNMHEERLAQFEAIRRSREPKDIFCICC